MIERILSEIGLFEMYIGFITIFFMGLIIWLIKQPDTTGVSDENTRRRS